MTVNESLFSISSSHIYAISRENEYFIDNIIKETQENTDGD